MLECCIHAAWGEKWWTVYPAVNSVSYSNDLADRIAYWCSRGKNVTRATNCFPAGLKAHSIRWSSCLAVFTWPKLETGEIVGPWREPNNSALPNGHKKKLFLKVLSLYLWITASLTTHKRGLCSRWRFNTDHCAENKSKRGLSSKWGTCIPPSP